MVKGICGTRRKERARVLARSYHTVKRAARLAVAILANSLVAMTLAIGFVAPAGAHALPKLLEQGGTDACMFVASILAAPIVYNFSVGGLASPSGSAPGPQIEPSVQRIIGWPWMSVSQLGPWPTRAQDDDPETSATGEISSQQTETSQSATISESATVAMSQPAATGAESPHSIKAVRTLDPDELKFLIRQGEQFASAGDLVTARALFQRAAEAGDATAAMALGATYDPNVLAKLGVIGMGADVEKARSWYQRAESQGLAQATRQLQALANR
jgi:hypothetical protein